MAYANAFCARGRIALSGGYLRPPGPVGGCKSFSYESGRKIGAGGIPVNLAFGPYFWAFSN
jgi:hypothetical protein